MADARIDANDRNLLTAYNQDTGAIERVLMDPVLDAVLVYGVADSGGTFTEIDRAKIDGNSRNTLSAYNEDTDAVESLRCSDEGYLLVTSV